MSAFNKWERKNDPLGVEFVLRNEKIDPNITCLKDTEKYINFLIIFLTSISIWPFTIKNANVPYIKCTKYRIIKKDIMDQTSESFSFDSDFKHGIKVQYFFSYRMQDFLAPNNKKQISVIGPFIWIMSLLSLRL